MPGRAGVVVGIVLWGGCTGLISVEAGDVRAAPVPEVAVVAALLAVAFVLRGPRPFTALGIVLGALLTQAVAIALTPATSFVTAYLVPCAVLAFSAGRRSERSVPVVAMVSTAALAALAAYALASARLGDARETLTGIIDWAGAVAVLVAIVIAPWLMGRYWRRHAELRTAGWEIADRMERARDLDAERARLRERSRIATEMHDSLGHELALIAVRAAALEMAPEGDGARGAATELRAAAHGANLRLREIIGVLRENAEHSEPEGAQRPGEHGMSGMPTSGETVEDVSVLVDRAVRAGLSAHLIREGPDTDPASPAGRAAHRVVREALTNAARHAPGAAVTVRMVREDGDSGGSTTVLVSDTGATASSPGSPKTPQAAEGGSGLAGLRTLVEGMGGDFNAGGSTEAEGGGPGGAVGGSGRRRGFGVSARIPDTADAPADPAPAGTETARRLHGARRGARRRLAAALAVPAALVALVAVAGFGVLWYLGTNSVLPPQDYARLSIGQERAAVERMLPRFDYPADELVDPPPVPSGATCRYYLVEWENGLPPVYRLCFADDRLAAKDRIARG
ncbi:nitrate/nitrite sensor protein NarQ [Streptomonospora litoralis]|uniref:histidine kinase n=1 Tax=Streptomonospora litoralis TaxID=2498135 RepID=A0A4P6Q3T8_9ACTN|nr:nitrate/nitrite sensor protein NarQ [Streptomonospora litoralis]